MPVRLVSHEELPGPLKGYRLIERLGRGGFGEVWKAEAPGGFLKAIKFVFGDLDSADEDSRPADQELKALDRVKSIRHPYILTLERFNIIDGQLIIVMELADRNLWDRFRECRGQGLVGIPREELLRYMEEAAEALDLMNNHYHIQHLDVKPQNLFLVFNHIKVADFGLAKLFEGERGTVTGGVTPVYAAPETFEGHVYRFTDQYSFGIVWQELLTGCRPFNGVNTKQLLMQHLNGQPDLSPLPAADRPLIGRALAKKPDERWPSCTDLVRALKVAGQGSGMIATHTPGPRGAAETLNASRPDTPRPYGTISPPSTPVGMAEALDGPRTRPLGPITPMPGGYGSGGVLNPLRTNLGSGGLITPRLVTPQGSGSSAHTLQRQSVLQTGRMSSLGIAPPERTGDGVLLPALVIAVGQTGLGVMGKFRQMIRDRFGSLDALPTLRFLYIDTDPEAIAAATQGPEALAAREVLLTRLNRPAHYLQASGAPQVESWLPPGILYRLPKNPGPADGVRSFGRLAFCDNYRVIAQRIRQDIETFLTDEPLHLAGQQTGLGVRTNRARTYLLAGTAGGTGSGMILDLAFVAKHELRSVGYRKPESVAVLVVPPADKASQKPAALANTYATLAELHHFATGNRYSTRFDADEATIDDADGPFTRCALVQLPKSSKPKDRESILGLAARGLFAELLTPTGRVTDYVRSVAPVMGNAATPVVQVFGIARLTWPRAELLVAATRRMSQRLLQRWAGRDAAHLKEPIHRFLAEQWSRQRLEIPTVIDRFGQVVTEILRETPEVVFDAVVEALKSGAPSGGRIDAASACAVLDQLFKMVGKPDAENAEPGSLEVAIVAGSKKFAAEAEKSLAGMAVQFIERPQYRLAGAEEALNQLTELLKLTVEELDGRRKVLRQDVRECFARLLQLIGGLGNSGLVGFGTRRSTLTTELFDLLRTYPQKRLQQAIVDASLSLYRGLLGSAPECIREVGLCRSRLVELGQSVAPPPDGLGDDGRTAIILPAGCSTLDEAADQFVGALAPDDLLRFDEDLQQEIVRKFRAVLNVCMKPARSEEFIALLAGKARAFLDARLERTDPATKFLHYQAGAAAPKMLADCFAKAAPDLSLMTGQTPMEAAVLAAPPGEAGDLVRRIAAEACLGIEFIPALNADDLVIYRECPRVELAALPQLAEAARDIYRGQLAAEFPPHSRVDIPWDSP